MLPLWRSVCLQAMVILGLWAPVNRTTAAASPASASRGPKIILSVIIDDMGWYDSQPHNPTAPTPTLGAWSKEGILLERQYTCASHTTRQQPVHARSSSRY
jgi:hypothetical protein